MGKKWKHFGLIRIKNNPKGKRREKRDQVSLYEWICVFLFKNSLSQLRLRLVDNDNLKRVQADMLSHQSVYNDSLLYNCLQSDTVQSWYNVLLLQIYFRNFDKELVKTKKRAGLNQATSWFVLKKQSSLFLFSFILFS